MKHTNIEEFNYTLSKLNTLDLFKDYIDSVDTLPTRTIRLWNQVEGKIDGSLVFDDSNERCVNVSHHTSLQLASDITVSAWVTTTNTDGNVNLIINKWGSATNRN